MNEVEELKKQVVKLTEKVIVLQQALSVAMRTEPSGTTTVGNLENVSAAQLDDNPLFYVEHPDGGLNVYLSQIVSIAREELPAENLTGTVPSSAIPDLPANKITSGIFDNARLPAAVNSGTAGSGFGGFRYTVSGATLNLFTS